MESSSDTKVRSPKDCTLVIMAKAPKTGVVKTRLARYLPEPAVLALYRCLLDDTIALAQSLDGVDVAIMCPASDFDDVARYVGNAVTVVEQTGRGLAAGLTSVFAHFAVHGQQRVIAFNSDSPHLPPSVLQDAFDVLASHDVVIGPTDDGGYYLVGAKCSYPTLFSSDGLGSNSALDRLLARTRTLQLSVGSTQLFYDIDVAADLMRLAAELPFASARAPRTAAWFEEWGQVLANVRIQAEL